MDGAGDVIATGFFQGTVDFGDPEGPLTSGSNGADVFLAKYEASSGDHIWSLNLEGPSPDRPAGVAVDNAGNVVLAAYLQTLSAKRHDLLVAKYGPAGEHLWSTRLLANSAGVDSAGCRSGGPVGTLGGPVIPVAWRKSGRD